MLMIKNAIAGEPCIDGPQRESDLKMYQCSYGIPSIKNWALQHVGDVFSINLIAWRRLAVHSANIVIHIQSDHIVRQTITFLLW